MDISPSEFERYSQGKASPEERARIERWLTREEEELPPVAGEEGRLASIWNKLEETLIKQEEQPTFSEWNRKSLWKYLIGTAACLLLLAGGMWYFWPENNPTLIGGHWADKNPATLKTVVTAVGQRTQVTLPDGTAVYLHSGSTFQYPETFAEQTRHVLLSGEAYFDVMPNKDKPFLIHTASSYTKVLGTAFNLRAYPDEDFAELTVANGKVEFGGHHVDGAALLSAGMQATVKDGKLSQRGDVGPEAFAWKENTLVIDNEPLQQVALRLERWFGIDVEIARKELETLTLTGTYKNASLDRILKSLQFTADIRYTYADRKLTFY